MRAIYEDAHGLATGWLVYPDVVVGRWAWSAYGRRGMNAGVESTEREAQDAARRSAEDLEHEH